MAHKALAVERVSAKRVSDLLPELGVQVGVRCKGLEANGALETGSTAGSTHSLCSTPLYFGELLGEKSFSVRLGRETSVLVLVLILVLVQGAAAAHG